MNKQQIYNKRESYRLIIRNSNKDIIINQIAFIIDIVIQDAFLYNI